MGLELSDNTWLFLIASLVGISCSQVGCFLVLRRLSMLGDAISHTVLLGIVLAFLITSSLSPVFMIPGAIIAGLATAFLSGAISRAGLISGDAGIGIVFTCFFALGIILLSYFAGDTHIDLDCVLYGELLFSPMDTIEWRGEDIGPRAFWSLLLVVILNSLFIFIGFRSLKFSAFDPIVARTQGVKVKLWHYLLMAAVSITTVVNIESVGAILVVAMLAVPANIALLLSKRLLDMLVLSSLLGVASAIGGITLSERADSSPSASVAIFAGLILLLVIFLKKFFSRAGLAAD